MNLSMDEPDPSIQRNHALGSFTQAISDIDAACKAVSFEFQELGFKIEEHFQALKSEKQKNSEAKSWYRRNRHL